jgi:hypothetical protein
MNRQQLEALVTKGAITQVGVLDECEKLSAQEVADKYITQAETAEEVAADAVPTDIPEIKEPKDPEDTNDGEIELIPTQDEVPASEEATPEAQSIADEVTAEAEDAVAEEIVEEATTTKKSSKKSTTTTEAPSVDPVEE